MLIDRPRVVSRKDAGLDMTPDIAWREWSEKSFEEARREGRLILLDLTASWCHWCHVMDDRTYSDPEIALAISKHFVPVRVDIDRRPDISERYNRGGFPTTAFLSDRGESIWGATFVPPTDMKRIMEAILIAKGSGEIDRALERNRIVFRDIEKAGKGVPVGPEQLTCIFEDIFSAYDTEHGGFGSEPKFPHPDVLDILLMKHVETGDQELADAVVNSLEHMASGLYDEVEGGVFRYSVTRDWRVPHYEKMLETNVGFLRNLVLAFGTIGDRGFDKLARGIARYLMTSLWDPNSGGFYGSQDADEEYYRLPGSARQSRKAPSVDRTVYAGWNAEASAALTIAGSILADEDMLRAGRASWRYALEHLWNPKLGLVRHIASEEVYLFEDQVSFFSALLARLGESMDGSVIDLADELIRGVDESFAGARGGFNDIMTGGEAIGELGTPRRSLVENSNWALALARLGGVAHRPQLVGRAREILGSFTQSEIESCGVFAAAYLRARWAADRGPVVVEIHEKAGSPAVRNRLLAVVRTHAHPSTVPVTFAEEGLSTPYAVVCTDKGCLGRTSDPRELLMSLRKIAGHAHDRLT